MSQTASRRSARFKTAPANSASQPLSFSNLDSASLLPATNSSGEQHGSPHVSIPMPPKRSKRKTMQEKSTTANALAAVKDYDKTDDLLRRIKKRKQGAKKATETNIEDFPMRLDRRWKVGPHVSAAGGVENTLLNAAAIGATAFALFVKSQRKWSSPALTEHSISMFKSRLTQFGYSPEHILPHGSYLVNLGNPDDEKREKSYECFLDDLKRCELLGLHLYNFHPGSTVGQGTPEHSLALIAKSINEAHKSTEKVIIVLENMAGAGNVLGSTFAQLAAIIRDVQDKSRVGVCLDTCHLFAAGYDIRTRDGWNETMADFDREIGIQYLRCMHLNDSKTALSSKKDRHENIGLGHLSLSAFAHIVTDPRTQNIPLILETPAFDGPGSGLGQGMDVWTKEVEVLNALSDLVPQTEAGSSSNVPVEAETSKMEEWTAEIRTVVMAASSRKVAKAGSSNGRKSSRRVSIKTRKSKAVDDSDVEESDDSHGGSA